MPARVGINALSLREGGGGAVRYGVELLRALSGDNPMTTFVVFVSRDAPRELAGGGWEPNVRVVTVPVGSGGKRNALMQLAGLLPLSLAYRVQVLHSLAGVGPHRVPRLFPTVVTLLDVIWLRLPDQVSMTAAERRSWIRLAGYSARGSARVIAISETAGSDIAAAFDLPTDKIDVTPLAARRPSVATVGEEADLRLRLGLGPGRLLLSVGQQQPYKAQAELIRALTLLDGDVELVLTGAPTAYGAELQRLAEQLDLDLRVHLLGYVADADLERLYAAATAVVQPSRMEGFGLPALEAMVRGCALACSGESALGEVVGDAALRFDPDDVRSIADAVGRLLGDADLRTQLGERGRERAAVFTWSATAAATCESYRRALKRR